MVLEPVSIIGLIGTAAGLLGFIVRNIEGTAVAGDVATHAKQIRDHLLGRIESCKRTLALWALLWHGSLHGLTEEQRNRRLRLFWGDAGVTEVELYKEGIARQAQYIHDLLYGPSILNVFDKKHPADQRAEQQWRECMDAEKKALQAVVDLPHARPEYANLCTRLTMALGQSTLLRDSISTLEQRIGYLESAARYRFKMHHLAGRDIPEIKQNDLETRFDLQKIAEGLCKVTNSLYNDLRGQCCQLAFLFTSPDTGLDDWLYDDQLCMDLLSFEREGLPSLPYNHLEAIIRDFHNPLASKGSHSKRNTSPLSSITRWSIKEDFASLTYDTDRVKDHKKRNTKLTRARTALSIAQWALILWNSPWIHGLSSCKIRYAESCDSNDGVPLLHYETCACSPTRKACKVPPPKARRPYLRLGLLLAELALSSSILACKDDKDELVFKLNNHQGPVEVGVLGLLELVKEETSHSGYFTAVSYCIILNTQAAAGRTEVLEPVAEYLHQVVAPLKEYYSKIYSRRHREKGATELLQNARIT